MPCANLPGVPFLAARLPRARRGARAGRDPGPRRRMARSGGAVTTCRPACRAAPATVAGDAAVADGAGRGAGGRGRRTLRPERGEVVGDLELAAMCGLPPFVDELIDVFIDEGMIVVGVPRLFTRPLRLNSVEAFELLAAARAAMELPGADPDGALAVASPSWRGRSARTTPPGSRSSSPSRRWSIGWRRQPPPTSSHASVYVGGNRDEATERPHRPPPGVHRSRRVVRQRRRRPVG